MLVAVMESLSGLCEEEIAQMCIRDRGVLKPVWIPISVITVVTTVLVMAVTAKVTQTVIHNSKKKKEKAEQETVR